jgi:hypothetical protein
MAAFSYGPNDEVYQEDCWQVLSTAAYLLDGCDLPLLTIIDHVCAEFPKGPAPERDAPPEESRRMPSLFFCTSCARSCPRGFTSRWGRASVRR